MLIQIILKDVSVADSLYNWCINKQLDVETLFTTDNDVLSLGIILQWLHDVYDIVIHADRSCYIICYGISEPLQCHLLRSYPKFKSLYIHEWYAQTKEEVTSMTDNMMTALEYVLTKLTDPF